MGEKGGLNNYSFLPLYAYMYHKYNKSTKLKTALRESAGAVIAHPESQGQEASCLTCTCTLGTQSVNALI